jgi:hypothetical protein
MTPRELGVFMRTISNWWLSGVVRLNLNSIAVSLTSLAFRKFGAKEISFGRERFGLQAFATARLNARVFGGLRGHFP